MLREANKAKKLKIQGRGQQDFPPSPSPPPPHDSKNCCLQTFCCPTAGIHPKFYLLEAAAWLEQVGSQINSVYFYQHRKAFISEICSGARNKKDLNKQTENPNPFAPPAGPARTGSAGRRGGEAQPSPWLPELCQHNFKAQSRLKKKQV